MDGFEEGLTELALALKSIATGTASIVPRTIGAPAESVAASTLASNPFIQSMVESQRALSAQIQAMMSNMANSNAGTAVTAQTGQSNPQGGQPDNKGKGGSRGRFSEAVERICRQYKFWCWSCGVNLSHIGCNCRTPKPGHINEATIDNPQGGNISKNARIMKWRHPISRATVDHCVII